MLNLTRLGATLSEKAAAITATKFADSPLSIFVLAVFCGIPVSYTHLDVYKRQSLISAISGLLEINVVYALDVFSPLTAESLKLSLIHI